MVFQCQGRVLASYAIAVVDEAIIAQLEAEQVHHFSRKVALEQAVYPDYWIA